MVVKSQFHFTAIVYYFQGFKDSLSPQKKVKRCCGRSQDWEWPRPFYPGHSPPPALSLTVTLQPSSLQWVHVLTASVLIAGDHLANQIQPAPLSTNHLSHSSLSFVFSLSHSQETFIKAAGRRRVAWAFDELRRYHTRLSDSIAAPNMYILEKNILLTQISMLGF